MIDKIQIVHQDVRESLSRMPFETVGRLLMALIAYANDEDYTEIIKDDPAAYIYFPTLQGHIDRMEESRVKQSVKGQLGGAPKGNQNARKTSKNNLKQPKTSKNNLKQTPNLTIPNHTNIKTIYGTANNVLLSEDEYKKIKDKGLEDLIEDLSLYMESKNKKYSNHYMTILAWGRRREKEKGSQVVKTNQFTSGATNTAYDFAELESRLVKN